MTAPMAAPSRLRIGDAVSWIASLLAAAIHEHGVIGRHRGLAAPMQHAIERVGHGLARDSSMSCSTSPIGRPRASSHRPAREAFGHGIQVVDARAGVGADHRVADRLQRDLGAILLREHRLLGALALGDVVNRAFVADDAAAAVAHAARVLQRHDLRAVAAAQHQFHRADFAVGIDAPHEIGAIGRAPVEHHRARQRVHLFGASVAEHLHEGAVHRDQAAVARALVHAFDDALEQAAEFRFAAAQRLLGEVALDGERGEPRGVRLQYLLALSRQARLGAVDAHRA